MNPKPPAPFDEWVQAPRSVWQMESAFDADVSAIPSSKSVRFAIVGAGMTGLLTAWELVQAGVSRDEIVVLDAMGPALGATGRNAGFVLSFPGIEILDWQSDFGTEGVEQLCKLNRANRDRVIAFITEWNSRNPTENILLQRGGSRCLAESEEEARELDLSMEVVSRSAPEEYALGPPAGALASRHYKRDLIGKRDAGIDPVAYARALATSANVPILIGEAGTVKDLRVDGDAVRLSLGNGEELSAQRVLFATNGYARAVLGDRWPVNPVRNQVMMVRCKTFDTLAEWGEAVFYANQGYDYWRVLPDGRLIVGGGRNRAPGGEEGIMEFGNQPESRAYLRDVLVPRLTNGKPFEIEAEWSGVMGFSPDGIPLLGAVPSTGNRVWFAGGFTGYGLGFHRVVAEAAAGCLMDHGDPGIFDASRVLNPAGRSS